MYMPTLGRFLSRDPSRVDVDLLSDNNAFGRQLDVMLSEAYGYALNNPVNSVDPSGLNWEDAGNLYQDVGGNPVSNTDPVELDSVPNNSMTPVHLCAKRPSIVPPKKNTCELAYSRQVNPGAICDRKRGEKAFFVNGRRYCVRCKGICVEMTEDCLPGYAAGKFFCACRETRPKPKPKPPQPMATACRCIGNVSADG